MEYCNDYEDGCDYCGNPYCAESCTEEGEYSDWQEAEDKEGEV